MKPKTHDAHDTKVLNKDRINTTNFSFASGSSMFRDTAMTDSVFI